MDGGSPTDMKNAYSPIIFRVELPKAWTTALMGIRACAKVKAADHWALEAYINQRLIAEPLTLFRIRRDRT